MDEEKVRLLVNLIWREKPKNDAASSDEMELAWNLQSLLVKWSDEKSSTHEEIVAKHFVMKMVLSEDSPFAKVSKRYKPTKKNNHRPRSNIHESVTILLFARANGISSAGREFGLSRSAIRSRIKKVALLFKLTDKDLLNMKSEIHDSHELEEILQGMSKYWIENKGGGE